MARARKVCSKPGCIEFQPCPLPGHQAKPWATSQRRQRTISGSAQRARAARVIARHHGICHICGKPGATIADHVIPLSPLADPAGIGGPDNEANLRPAHAEPCHRDKTAAEAARARGVRPRG